MHLRRIASFVLGAWLAGSLFALYLSTNTTSAAETVLSLSPLPPQVTTMMKTLGADQMKMLVGFEAAEQSRYYLTDWGNFQLLWGPLLFLALLASRKVNRLMLGVCGAMFVLALFSTLVLLPELHYLSRNLHFSDGWSSDRARYLVLHATYVVLEALKTAMGLLLAGYLFSFRKRPAPVVAAASGETGPAVEVSD
jgi:hypothetical protein